jgi:hypothetical protein
MVDVVAADRPWMERDRAHLRRPGDDSHLARTDLVRMAAGGELDPRGLHVVRGAAGDPLLEKGVAAAAITRREDEALLNPLRPALERGGPPVERPHDALADGQVVLDDVELRERPRALGLREDHPIRAGNPNLALAGLHDRRFRHSWSVRPINRLARMQPSPQIAALDSTGAYAPTVGSLRPGARRRRFCPVVIWTKIEGDSR